MNTRSIPDSDSLVEQALATRWEEDRACAWRRNRPWWVGCNFVPGSAVNQLEMWQADTFDPERIDRELGWLAGIGMNSIRVFLHDLAWDQDKAGFLDRMDRFLGLAQRHGIGVMPVFFDGCWHPFPHAGKQRDPEPGVHNSFWLQSPGAAILRDSKKFKKLRNYVTGVIGHFRDDSRIHFWDLWNEPENPNASNWGVRDIPPGQKAALIVPLLAQTILWARSARPSQPLTSGIWAPGWEKSDADLHPLHALQMSGSDVVSFHTYTALEGARAMVERLKLLRRPLFCTEYMSRPTRSTFKSILPYFKSEGIAAYNWGSVSGRTQTIHPWNSWQFPGPPEPKVWFHDIFRPDGKPYDRKETDLIASLLKPSPVPN